VELGGWIDGQMDEWIDIIVVLRIAYSNNNLRELLHLI
jgi:hypothetical protein